MFAGLANLVSPAPLATSPPENVPPATQINLPCCRPQVKDSGGQASHLHQGRRAKPLPALLQEIIRPTEVDRRHFEALGVHVIPDASARELIPDPDVIPDFAHWDSLSLDEAFNISEEGRRPLNNGGFSPSAVTYRDRTRELSIPNDAAFRAVRRIQPPPGKSQVRLGNSFEFFRNLDMFGNFWDDTSRPPVSGRAEVREEADRRADGETAEAEDSTAADNGSDQHQTAQAEYFFRTASGSSMPPEHRHNILTSFLKLVAYDFGCNVSAPRTEPRLYLNAPTLARDGEMGTSNPSLADINSPAKRHSSYFASGCAFIFRTPSTRADARSGVVDGPIAAVSARHSTAFPPPRPPVASPSSSSSPGTAPTAFDSTDRDSVLDLARELVAALMTAQHRRREGRKERRIGEGTWWATKPRWGGGPGGPIGREVDLSAGDDVIGDKDEIPSDGTAAVDAPATTSHRSNESNSKGNSKTSYAAAAAGAAPPASAGGKPATKKPRKNLPAYDNYRIVRPPSAAWDAKTRYAALGRPRGADYDDIFLVSSLFHHVSVVRVRVPDRLLDVLDGTADDGEDEGGRSWGRLEVWRSPWFDFFKAEDRIAAMRLVWAMMAYVMRREDDQPAAATSGAAKGHDKDGTQKEAVEKEGDVKMMDA